MDTTDRRTALALKAAHLLKRPIVDLTAIPRKPKRRRARSCSDEYLAQRREWLNSGREVQHAPIFFLNPHSRPDSLIAMFPEHGYWLG